MKDEVNSLVLFFRERRLRIRMTTISKGMVLADLNSTIPIYYGL